MKRHAGRPERSSIVTAARNVQYMSMLLLGRQKLMLLKSMYNTEIILKLAPPTHHNNDTCGSKLPIAGGRDKGATTTQMVRRHWISLLVGCLQWSYGLRILGKERAGRAPKPDTEEHSKKMKKEEHMLTEEHSMNMEESCYLIG